MDTSPSRVRWTGHRSAPGGPPPDGIPSIDYPLFQPVSEVDWLDDDEPVLSLTTAPDTRLPVRARVVGVGDGRSAVAVSRDLLAQQGVQHVQVGPDRVVLWHVPGQVSALDTRLIPEGAEIGSVAAFVADADGRAPDFTPADDGTFRDQQTGSVWNLFGRAVSGPLAGQQLTAVEHLDTFWFAWTAFQPETRLAAAS